MATTAADLTYAQLESLWTGAGGSSSTEETAAAIAEAESSGRTDATSSNPDGGTNVGLWQLDTPGGVGAGYSVAQLEDPQTNAAVAVQGSANGTNWSDWATYASGAYKQFLGGKNSGSGSGAGNSSPYSNITWYEPWTWLNAPGDAAAQGTDEIVHYGAIALAVAAALTLGIVGLVRSTGHRMPNPVTVAAPAAAALV